MTMRWRSGGRRLHDAGLHGARLVARHAAAFVIAAGALAAPRTAQAQAQAQPAPAAALAVLQGVVTDSASQPIAGVTVTTVGDAARPVVTDDAGAFRLAGLPAGKVQFTARRLGFAPARFDIEMPARATVHVAIRMGRTAVVLGTVVVEGGKPDGQLLAEGFYDRRRSAHGQFISPEQVERRRMAHASALFRDVPSVSLRRGVAGQTTLVTRNTAGYCPLDVWIDGYHTPLLASLGFDDVVNMNHVKAAEVYRSWREVPQRFRRPESDCGAVVVWTSAPDDP
jgi:hypothetical protein